MNYATRTTISVTIDGNGAELLEGMAEHHGTTSHGLMEALINYAFSCLRDPNSPEASRPFIFADYDKKQGGFNGRWF